MSSKCSSCGADIVWLKTHTGSNMPVNAETVKPGDTEYKWGSEHKSHFATCPKADEHRRAR